jgi:hypothetical protein
MGPKVAVLAQATPCTLRSRFINLLASCSRFFDITSSDTALLVLTFIAA